MLIFWCFGAKHRVPCACLIAKEEDDEIEITPETTAQKIQSKSKNLAVDKMHYTARLDMQEVLGSVSPTLLELLEKLSGKLEYTMPAALIGRPNIVTSLLINSTTTLQIALGVVLGKRALIEQFSDFAVACTALVCPLAMQRKCSRLH